MKRADGRKPPESRLRERLAWRSAGEKLHASLADTSLSQQLSWLELQDVSGITETPQRPVLA